MSKSGQMLVSVAIATYNGERYLQEQLDSIYNQTYKNFEVIVSDDRSTDNTISILESYKKKFGLNYSINDKNLGVLKNFENAISKCSGEYILLSDQDDIWISNKIETLVENIGGFSLIYSDGYIINGEIISHESKISQQKWMKPFGIDSSNQNLYKYLIFNSFILGCSLMFKRDLLKMALPFYKSYRNHDWWLAICAENELGIKYIDDTLFYYRVHEANYSIGTKLSIRNKIFSVFSRDRIGSRNLLQNNDKVIFNYLARSHFFKDLTKIKYIDIIINIHNANKSISSRLAFFVFLVKSTKFIFPKNNISRMSLLIILRTIENQNQISRNK